MKSYRDGDLVGFDKWGGPDFLGGSPLEFEPGCEIENELGRSVSCLNCPKPCW